MIDKLYQSMLPLIIPTIAYLISYIYEINYMSYYGIPDWLVEIDTQTQIKDWLLVILPIMTFTLFFYSLYSKMKSPFTSPSTRWLARYLFVCFTFRMLTIKEITEVSVILLIATLLLVIEIILIPLMNINIFIRKRDRIIKMIKYRIKNRKNTPKIVNSILVYRYAYEFLLGRGQRATKKLVDAFFPVTKDYKAILKFLLLWGFFLLALVNFGYYNASKKESFTILSTYSNNYVVVGKFNNHLIAEKVDLKKGTINANHFYLLNIPPSNGMNITVFNIHRYLRIERSDKITISTLN